jgi:hypothetical protein
MHIMGISSFTFFELQLTRAICSSANLIQTYMKDGDILHVNHIAYSDLQKQNVI